MEDCKECNGKGYHELFVSKAHCDKCGGTGEIKSFLTAKDIVSVQPMAPLSPIFYYEYKYDTCVKDLVEKKDDTKDLIEDIKANLAACVEKFLFFPLTEETMHKIHATILHEIDVMRKCGMINNAPWFQVSSNEGNVDIDFEDEFEIRNMHIHQAGLAPIVEESLECQDYDYVGMVEPDKNYSFNIDVNFDMNIDVAKVLEKQTTTKIDEMSEMSETMLKQELIRLNKQLIL